MKRRFLAPYPSYVVFLAAALVCGAAFSEASFAEEAPRGRLADGRAYRTDEAGNQLVDYIAELEVNAEALQRRVVGLEDEVAEKQRVIERLQQGQSEAAAVRPELTERNLGPATVHANQAAGPESGELIRAKADIDRLERELSAAQSAQAAAAAAAEQDCRASAERSLAATGGQLTAVRTALEAEQRARADADGRLADVSRRYNELRAAPPRDCNLEVAAALKNSAGSTAQREAVLREEFAVERRRQGEQLENALGQSEALQREVTAARTDLAALKAALAASDERAAAAATQSDDIHELRVELEEARSDGASARAALADAAAQLGETRKLLNEARAGAASTAAASGAAVSVAAVRQPVPRDYASRARVAAVDSLRGNVMSELNQVRGVVAARDAAFRRAAESPSGAVQFKPTPLLSTRRRTLPQVADEIRSAQQVHELTALRADLAEIRALAQEDIDLLRRTGRG